MEALRTEKFKPVGLSDNTEMYQRVIIGRVTRARYNTIRSAVRLWNYRNAAPYGLSPNGYRYTCGCEHDCCGHLFTQGIELICEGAGEFGKIVLTLHKSYNF